MVYVNPRICNEDIFDIYKKEYFRRANETGYENYELTAPLRIKTFAQWYRDLQRYLPSTFTSAIDIGCAAGYFLDLLIKNGWRHVEGIELNTRMHAELRNRSIDVSDTPLEQFIPVRRYHLITLFDVIEHLPDINNDFKKLSAMLDENGIIAIVTPDFASLQRKFFGKRWFQFKPREHIYYFTPRTLSLIADKHGFDVVHLSASGQFADFDFLSNRLSTYKFPIIAKLFSLACTLLHSKGKSWYIGTGSMFAILKKKSEDTRL